MKCPKCGEKRWVYSARDVKTGKLIWGCVKCKHQWSKGERDAE